MNAKQILGASFLVVFAAASSARTISAEEWVGSPIVSSSTATRDAVRSDFFASNAGRQAPQELRVGPADAGPGLVNRVEVLADTRLWLRSGLGMVAYTDSFDPRSTSYREKVAMYRRLRDGPAYMAEVEQMQGRTKTTAMTMK